MERFLHEIYYLWSGSKNRPNKMLSSTFAAAKQLLILTPQINSGESSTFSTKFIIVPQERNRDHKQMYFKPNTLFRCLINLTWQVDLLKAF